MSDLALPRFYVVATTGYSVVPGRWSSSRQSTSLAILDRLWAYREVWSDYATKGSGVMLATRHRRADERCAELNARHEQRLREVA